jgi:hypothetical protein
MSAARPFRLALLAAALLSLGAAPRTPAGDDALDGVARDYVRLSLEADVHDPGYVDAYYGPADWRAQAKAHPRDLPTLLADAGALKRRAEAADPQRLSPLAQRRRAFLIGQLTAAQTRLAMRGGKRFSFEDEAAGLFSVRPRMKPLSDYDPVLARINLLVPGPGPLWKRVDDFNDRFIVPPNRLDAVMRAAIAECRRRTLEHIALPANERFTLEFVKNKPWGGYNFYQGDDASLIQVNTDLPAPLSRAVDLGCHEGYPGHHVLNTLLEERLSKAKGWVEFSVYPLFSPESLIAEGSANYGIELAFPGDEQRRFEAKTLYPLASLNPADAERYSGLLEAMKELAGARFTIARDYLDGRIDRAKAVELTQRYLLVSKARAEKSIDFDDTYRSYVINYGLGQDMVRDYVAAAGPSPEARWKRMERVLSEPTTPADLLKRS